MANYINCFCAKWDFEYRQEHLCKTCNNTQKIPDPKEILCNLCGECMCPIGKMNEHFPHGLHKAKVEGGYNSTHLLDLNQYIFSFCEACLRKLFVQCKIPPIVKYMDDVDKDYTFANDQKTYEYMEWEKTDGPHQAYLNGLCNIEKDCQNKAIYTILDREGLFTEGATCEAHKELHLWLGYSLTKFINEKCKLLL